MHDNPSIHTAKKGKALLEKSGVEIVQISIRSNICGLRSDLVWKLHLELKEVRGDKCKENGLEMRNRARGQ